MEVKVSFFKSRIDEQTSWDAESLDHLVTMNDLGWNSLVCELGPDEIAKCIAELMRFSLYYHQAALSERTLETTARIQDRAFMLGTLALRFKYTFN